ncbi:DEAD/DEAH box helicase [Desertibacillus haloalkaliphilus]|uniref:DEAD/DEAH box helicase n=1 Tax=Desertibacillus haloalkaliphilus TaxID=1328930 RepID=UPI001C263ACB|nr:DEAD/DEAH box helicase [Desertibacillus haloalkaliphilus]MBU8905982.1 DEAD/DEAH box helicase [Desertibacillus haloalkaliphilus]
MKFVAYSDHDHIFIAPIHYAPPKEQWCTPPTAISKLPSFETPLLNLQFPYSHDLQTTLSGKQLLLSELSFDLDHIHHHYIHGYLAYHAGITTEKGRTYCQRCGNDDPQLFATYRCARCDDMCTYCRNCLMLGRVSECTPLVRWCGPELKLHPPQKLLTWTGELSTGQARASQAIREAVGSGCELLIWAVCGAGKTEVLFSGIEAALRQGQAVAIATPRTDVVIELAPRLRSVFPDVGVIALYGGSEDRGKQGQLVIATTHQLMRYREQFDFVVIDEVDAFPYSVDQSLTYAVSNAKKPQATTVYLTATPSPELKRRVRKDELAAIKIPRRYHGHPLPVPRFCWSGNWQKRLKKGKLPSIVRKWVEEKLADNKQAFLFVPSVEALQRLVDVLQKIDSRIIGVHAEDEERREKVASFREGRTPILVTTTILERGVTVANTDVAVLGAEEAIFTESALVQISGRVGRSANHPRGDVLFFHYGKTKAMVEARAHIVAMNDAEVR